MNLRRFLVEEIKLNSELKFYFLAQVEDKDVKADAEVENDMMNLMKNEKGSAAGSDYLNLFGSIPKLLCNLPWKKCKQHKKPEKPKKNKTFDVIDDYLYNYYG